MKRTRLKFTLSQNKRIAKAVCKYGTFIIAIKDPKKGGVILTPYFQEKLKK
jgi:hypothetical protein